MFAWQMTRRECLSNRSGIQEKERRDLFVFIRSRDRGWAFIRQFKVELHPKLTNSLSSNLELTHIWRHPGSFTWAGYLHWWSRCWIKLFSLILIIPIGNLWTSRQCQRHQNDWLCMFAYALSCATDSFGTIHEIGRDINVQSSIVLFRMC